MSGKATHKVKILTKDDEIFEVDPKVAKLFGTIKHLLESLGGGDSGENINEDPIPVSVVVGTIFKKVLEWVEHYKDDEKTLRRDEDEIAYRTDDIPTWDQEFLRVDQGTLFEILLAANFLDVKGLLDVCCKTVANMLKGKSVEDIRRQFNIKNDFTPEEEDAIRRENEWFERGDD